MALWEMKRPKRVLSQPKGYRWANNLSLVLVNGLVLPLTLPILAVAFAALMQEQQFGLFNWLSLPIALNVLLCVIALDCIIYWQHRLFHRLPILWRLHRVHHADQDIDVTTGARFHFIEIWLSMIIKLAAIALLGAPPLAVLIFEIVLNASAMFNHSNIAISKKIDNAIRALFVTPDMHRVHHSVARNETDSNFGFCLSVWDRIFKSYIAQPKLGHQNMHIGISLFREANEQSFWKMLTQPFRGGK